MSRVTIQQRTIPPDLFGPLVDFPGRRKTADIQEFLDRHGYVLLRQALDREQVLAAREEVLSRLQQVGEVQEPAMEGVVTGRSQRPDPAEDGGRFWAEVNHGRALRAVTHGPATHDVVGRVFGESARAHDLMYLRPMPPGGVTPLHYDYPFFAGESERIHTVWIPLGDVSVVEGPLMLVERSFEFDDLLASIKAVDFKTDRSNETVQAAAYDAQNDLHPVDLAQQRSVRLLSTDFEAGDVVIFPGFTLHGSLDNNSPARSIRLSCDVRYQPAADPHDDQRYFGSQPKGGGYADMRGAQPIRSD